MTTVIIMIAMLMPFVPTTMAEAEEVLGMLEEVMIVITSTEVASKAFTNKVFNINNKNNNQQNFKDIFMKEDEDVEVEEEVSSFDNLLLLNNNESSPMTTRPSLWWWFTKDVLRRTTKEGTQLDEEDYDVDDEEAEAEERNRNRGIKVGVKGGSLVERGAGRSLRRKGSIPRRARSRTHVSRHFFMCPVASEGSNSLVAVSLEGR